MKNLMRAAPWVLVFGLAVSLHPTRAIASESDRTHCEDEECDGVGLGSCNAQQEYDACVNACMAQADKDNSDARR
jgi:hypothetical protein